MTRAKKLKVAMVNTELTRGGAARMAAALADAMNKIGDVEVKLYHCQSNHQTESFHGLKRPYSRQLNAAMARVGGSFCVWDRGVADEIISLTKDADILHIHNLHGYYLNFEKLLTAWKDRPVVWTWHDMWGATGRCGFSFECERWQIGCPICPSMELYPAAIIDRASEEFKKKTALFSKLRNLTIISPSEWLTEIARKRGFFSAKFQTISNPGNVDSYKYLNKEDAREVLGLDRNKVTFLYIAADCNDLRKGYKDFEDVCRERDECNVVVVGKPPKVKYKKFQYIGSVSESSKLNLYYAAADVMVMPTYADNYPNTVIESLLSGTPVIAYAVGGIASQLADFVECKTVPMGVKSELKTFIDELRPKSDANGREISERAKRLWSIGNCASKYFDVYRTSLGDE